MVNQSFELSMRTMWFSYQLLLISMEVLPLLLNAFFSMAWNSLHLYTSPAPPHKLPTIMLLLLLLHLPSWPKLTIMESHIPTYTIWQLISLLVLQYTGLPSPWPQYHFCNYITPVLKHSCNLFLQNFTDLATVPSCPCCHSWHIPALCLLPEVDPSVSGLPHVSVLHLLANISFIHTYIPNLYKHRDAAQSWDLCPKQALGATKRCLSWASWWVSLHSACLSPLTGLGSGDLGPGLEPCSLAT